MITLDLIKGRYSKEEAIEIVTQLIETKIRFNELKIKTLSNEEDISMRERRISELQEDLMRFRNQLLAGGESVHVSTSLKIRQFNLN